MEVASQTEDESRGPGISRVIAVIVADGAINSRVEMLKRILSNELFTILDLSAEGAFIRTSSSPNDTREKEIYLEALNRSRKIDAGAPVLVVKETSISLVEPNTIASFVLETFKVPGWDLFYFCNWNDRCQLLQPVPLGVKEGTNSKYYGRHNPRLNLPYAMMRTFAPGGLQAVLFSAEGRDRILSRIPMRDSNSFAHTSSLESQLHEYIESGGLRSYCFVPNIFEYDVALNAISNQDYLKLNLCRPLETEIVPHTIGAHGVILVILMLVVVAVLAWLLLRMLARSRMK